MFTVNYIATPIVLVAAFVWLMRESLRGPGEEL
jgi:hypothetical protein